MPAFARLRPVVVDASGPGQTLILAIPTSIHRLPTNEKVFQPFYQIDRLMIDSKAIYSLLVVQREVI